MQGNTEHVNTLAYSYIFVAVNDMKVQQSSRIKAIERKYQQIILDKTDKHKKEIDVNHI